VNRIIILFFNNLLILSYFFLIFHYFSGAFLATLSKPKKHLSFSALRDSMSSHFNAIHDNREHHHMAEQNDDRYIQYLCDEMNQTQTIFPKNEFKNGL